MYPNVLPPCGEMSVQQLAILHFSEGSHLDEYHHTYTHTLSFVRIKRHHFFCHKTYLFKMLLRRGNTQRKDKWLNRG